MALRSLTAEFEMGSGSGSSLKSPDRLRTWHRAWPGAVACYCQRGRAPDPEPAGSGGAFSTASHRGWRNGQTSSRPRTPGGFGKAEWPPAPMGRSAGTKCRPSQKSLPRTWIMRGDQADRAISTGQLNASPRLHAQPINVVVFHGPDREFSFRGGFPA